MRIVRRSWGGEDASALAADLRRASPDPEGIAVAVAETIRRVREGGDAALAELGERYDGVRATTLRVERASLAAAAAALPAELRQAIELSAANVRTVAESQLGVAHETELGQGQRVRISEIPVGAAGIYAPGGRAAYPSSVLMGVIPAFVAGVERVVVASPPDADGIPAQVVLAAAHLAGAGEVYATGGAQAIAALAYGTETVAPVDVIAGPGGPWVQEAKLQVSRAVGIDGFAGPSELMVICDGHVDAGWIALDLCAQAEHGSDGILVAAGTDVFVLDRIAAEIEGLSDTRPSVGDARVELIEVPELTGALALAQALAPEHLQLDCDDAGELAEAVTTAGCVFVGPRSGAAFGDYAAGSNHVLPTGGAGRFSGPLGPATFRRRISRVEIGPGAAAALAPAVDVFARSEGFPVHGESARARATGSREPGS